MNRIYKSWPKVIIFFGEIKARYHQKMRNVFFVFPFFRFSCTYNRDSETLLVLFEHFLFDIIIGFGHKL